MHKKNDDPDSSFLDTEDFVPIDPNWRQKYYRRVFKKRLYAFLLDIFFIPAIFCIVVFLVGYLFYFLIKIENPDSRIVSEIAVSDIDVFDIEFSVFIYVLMFIVLAIMESSKLKGTVGKRIMKIQITDNYGNSISFWRSLLRNILKVLAFFSYFLIIPAIIQYFTFKKSSKLFHDKFSSTIIGERL